MPSQPRGGRVSRPSTRLISATKTGDVAMISAVTEAEVMREPGKKERLIEARADHARHEQLGQSRRSHAQAALGDSAR